MVHIDILYPIFFLGIIEMMLIVSIHGCHLLYTHGVPPPSASFYDDEMYCKTCQMVVFNGVVYLPTFELHCAMGVLSVFKHHIDFFHTSSAAY